VEPDPNAKKPRPPPGAPPPPSKDGKPDVPKGFENFFDNPKPETQRESESAREAGKKDDGSQEEASEKQQNSKKKSERYFWSFRGCLGPPM
jgi:hypothetical protein